MQKGYKKSHREEECKYFNLSLFPFFLWAADNAPQQCSPTATHVEARNQESPLVYPDKPAAWSSRVKTRAGRADGSFPAQHPNRGNKYMQCKQFNKVNYGHQRKETSIPIFNYSYKKERVRKHCCIRLEKGRGYSFITISWDSKIEQKICVRGNLPL